MGQRFSMSRVGQSLEKTSNVLLKELKRSSQKGFFFVLTVLKISPFAVPGLIYLGSIKVASTKKLLLYTTIVSLITNTIIVFLGYKTGMKILEFTRVYNLYQFIGIILLILLFVSLLIRVYKKEIEEFVAKFLKRNIK
jgi:membrane protein DedA with SNARE-associated domain